LTLLEVQVDYFVTKYESDCPGGAARAVLEDSIMHKGRPATAGSKILENFISPLDATVITRLEAAGVCIPGKTKMDEFGCSGLFSNSEFGIRNSEFNTGAVTAVADGVADFALCNDYTGAVSSYAAARGLCYVHPTYGSVSRYGLIPAVQSMDQIGVVCRTPAEGFRALSMIAGLDPKDGAMFPDAERNSDFGIPKSEFRIGVPKNVLTQIPDSQASAVNEFVKELTTVEFELKYFGAYAAVMRILCCAELSNNITRYDGIKFGYRTENYDGLREIYTKSRTEAFGEDTKLAAIIGSMVLSRGNYMRYYDKAMRIRRIIKESLCFDLYDAIVMPCGAESGIAGQETSGDCVGQNAALALALHALPRLCGLPAVTVPHCGGGVTLIAAANREDILKTMLIS